MLEHVCQLARNAGDAIMQVYDGIKPMEITSKQDDSPVTAADIAAHTVILEGLLALTPDIPVLSEEAPPGWDVRQHWQRYWLVDPLDGTKEFIKKNGEFTVNIALVEKGVPVLGVIYVPVRKELYFASSSVGAYKFTGIDSSSQPSMDEMKQRAIHLPMALAHQGVVVVASRSHQTEETTAFIDNLRKQGKPVTLISSGSSLKICLVAEGSADIYPRFAPTMEWDTAAGHAIAKSAGCDIYHIDGKTPLRYNKEDLHNPWFIVK